MVSYPMERAGLLGQYFNPVPLSALVTDVQEPEFIAFDDETASNALNLVYELRNAIWDFAPMQLDRIVRRFHSTSYRLFQAVEDYKPIEHGDLSISAVHTNGMTVLRVLCVGNEIYSRSTSDSLAESAEEL